MSIDEAVQLAVNNILRDGKYCSEEKSKEIAEEVSQKVRADFEHDLDAVKADFDKMRQREDRMWNIVHRFEEPKFPRVRKFFSFRWLGWLLFWRR